MLADAALAAGGEVIGVIPQALLDREIGHRGLTELRVVDSMHARKALMGELADGFVALSGGIGTLEELFEVWTWTQLGLPQALRLARCGRILRSAGRFSRSRSRSRIHPSDVPGDARRGVDTARASGPVCRL